MSQIGQKMSELEQKMCHGVWPALIWTVPLWLCQQRAVSYFKLGNPTKSLMISVGVSNTLCLLPKRTLCLIGYLTLFKVRDLFIYQTYKIKNKSHMLNRSLLANLLCTKVLFSSILKSSNKKSPHFFFIWTLAGYSRCWMI